MIYVQDTDMTLHQGDCLEVLQTLPDRSVHMCCTSPPFYGLRDYGTGSWERGDPGCDHRHETAHQKQGVSSVRKGCTNVEHQRNENFRNTCGRCGARRVDRQIGLEDTPDQWVARLVDVFRQVRRVLRDDGTLWIEIGDSYNNRAKVRESSHQPSLNNYEDDNWAERAALGGVRMSINNGDLKEKDLLGQPWLLAFALRADGWWLRSEIIWNKPNPMPESVTDRPTKSHSTVFLLAKRPRYFFDADAIREAFTTPWDDRGHRKTERHHHVTPALAGGSARGINGEAPNPAGANARSVWTIATEPTPFAHFATWPQKLCARMILAGCPEGGTVLDPFGGSGTTALVARNLGRRSTLIELSGDYCRLAARRLQQLSLLTEAAP